MHCSILRFSAKIFAILSLLIFSAYTFATEDHYYVRGEVGYNHSHVSSNNPQLTYYSGQLTDSYPDTESHFSTAMAGVGLGYEFLPNCCDSILSLGLGLGLYATSPHANLSGQVNETAVGNPTLAFFNYRFNVNSTRVMAEAQLTWSLNSFTPFINAGVGPAFNHIGDYRESGITNNYPPLPPFQSHTQTTVAYQVGAGLGYAFNFSASDNFLQERIALGYRYVNLGQVTTGIRNASYPYRLNFDRIVSNEFYLAYTHLI